VNIAKTGAEVIPLQTLGIVDASADEVSDDNLLAHTLVNVVNGDKLEGFAVRRSSDFINEYARKDANGEPTDGGVDDPNHLYSAFPC
jgi:hypothetical protein